MIVILFALEIAQTMNKPAPPKDSRGNQLHPPRSAHPHHRKLSANFEIQSSERTSRMPEWSDEVRPNL